MSVQGQRQTVAIAALVTLSVGVIAALQRDKGLPAAGFWVGYGFAFIVMSMMVDLGIPIGAGFALILMVATVLENAEDVVAWLGVMSAHKPKPPAGGGGATPQLPPGQRSAALFTPTAPATAAPAGTPNRHAMPDPFGVPTINGRPIQ